MADFLKGDLGTGVLFGVGALVLAPLAGRVIRPVAKAAVKGGMTLYRETGIGDVAEDLLAEARSELDGDGRRSREGRQAKSTAKAD